MDDSTRDPQGVDDPDPPDDGPDDWGDDADGDDDESQWRFGLEEVGEDGIVRPQIEPGDPSLENVVFILLGIAATILLVFRLWLLL